MTVRPELSLRNGKAAQAPASSDDLKTGFPDSSRTYDPLIRQLASEYRMSARLIKAVVEQESQFDFAAVSKCGAMGLMQLMPETAYKDLGVRDLLDPAQNLRGGTKHLARLLNLYKGDVRLTLAAYNAGSTKVAKYNDIPPFAETLSFVAKIIARYGGSLTVRPPGDVADVKLTAVSSGVYAPPPRRR